MVRIPGDISDCTLALVRAVPEALTRCELTWISREPIDLAAAHRSHADYVATLEAAGLRVEVVAADEAHPDCPFVEDLLVEIGDTRVVCNPGAEARRGERRGILEWLDGLGGRARTMPDGLFMDGGDVLQLGGFVFVGRSTRTSSEAITWLRGEVACPVIEVPLTGRLHLKTLVTPVDARTLLVADAPGRTVGEFLRESLPDLEILVTPGEPDAANVLRLPDGSVVVAAGFPGTAALLEARGISVGTVDIAPFAKAEAGLTCLSVLLSERSILS